ncbi:MAG TPA: xanthine dehydrogenase family protein subunit M, partial [Capillimicrobium sp.]
DLLAAHPGARPLAGGQSIVNVLKLRAAEVEALIDVSRLEELRRVEPTADGGLEIGAGVRYAELAADPLVRERFAVIAEVADGTVDVQVRNRGTLGGNICFNDPTSNFPPLLVALDATVLVAGPGGAEREVPAEEFLVGPLRVDLAPGELVRAVRFPGLPADAGVGYETLQLARDSWALARGVAFVQANGTVSEARIVLGCLGPRPTRQAAMEEALRGTAGDEASIDAAVAAAIDADAVSDSHASAEYRFEMARVYARRAIAKAMAQTGDHA